MTCLRWSQDRYILCVKHCAFCACAVSFSILSSLLSGSLSSACSYHACSPKYIISCKCRPAGSYACFGLCSCPFFPDSLLWTIIVDSVFVNTSSGTLPTRALAVFPSTTYTPYICSGRKEELLAFWGHGAVAGLAGVTLISVMVVDRQGVRRGLMHILLLL